MNPPYIGFYFLFIIPLSFLEFNLPNSLGSEGLLTLSITEFGNIIDKVFETYRKLKTLNINKSKNILIAL